jgi:hypothetical protein
MKFAGGNWMKKLQAVLAVVLIFVALTAAHSSNQPSKRVVMVIARQSSAPATLSEATFGRYDLVERAKLTNQSSKTVDSYKIGWITISDSGALRYGKGITLNISGGMPPNESAAVPQQNFSPAILRKDVTRIIFYVAELHFSDGTQWREKLDTVRQELK